MLRHASVMVRFQGSLRPRRLCGAFLQRIVSACLDRARFRGRGTLPQSTADLRAVAGAGMVFKQKVQRLLMNNDTGTTQSNATEELTDNGVSARRKALSAILLLVLLLLILLLFAAAVERTDIINFTSAHLALLT